MGTASTKATNAGEIITAADTSTVTDPLAAAKAVNVVTRGVSMNINFTAENAGGKFVHGAQIDARGYAHGLKVKPIQKFL